jgi:hypothetical protein
MCSRSLERGGPVRRQPVESSSLQSVGYDATNQVLEVQFRTGRVYRYLGVPPDVYTALMQASSLGAFFNARIRDHYPFERIS